jgi:uncharacterized protein YciI
MKKAMVLFQRHGSQWNPDKPVREQAYWDEHARFVDTLYAAGKVLLAGPFADGSGSLVVLDAENPEAARALFREDPWAQRDILVAAEVKEWTIFLDARDRT